MSLQCKFCQYKYENQPISILQLHFCNDQEYHFIDRIDLEEEPLEELKKDPKPIKARNMFSRSMLY